MDHRRRRHQAGRKLAERAYLAPVRLDTGSTHTHTRPRLMNAGQEGTWPAPRASCRGWPIVGRGLAPSVSQQSSDANSNVWPPSVALAAPVCTPVLPKQSPRWMGARQRQFRRYTGSGRASRQVARRQMPVDLLLVARNRCLCRALGLELGVHWPLVGARRAPIRWRRSR